MPRGRRVQRAVLQNRDDEDEEESKPCCAEAKKIKGRRRKSLEQTTANINRPLPVELLVEPERVLKNENSIPTTDSNSETYARIDELRRSVDRISTRLVFLESGFIQIHGLIEAVRAALLRLAYNMANGVGSSEKNGTPLSSPRNTAPAAAGAAPTPTTTPVTTAGTTSSEIETSKLFSHARECSSFSPSDTNSNNAKHHERFSTGLPSGVWYDRVENRYVVQCNETTACGRKKRKYFGVARYGEAQARQNAIAARLCVLGLYNRSLEELTPVAKRRRTVDNLTPGEDIPVLTADDILRPRGHSQPSEQEADK